MSALACAAILFLATTPIQDDDALAESVARLAARPMIDARLDDLYSRLTAENRVDEFLQLYETKRKQLPDAPGPHIVVGLLQLQRGQGIAAVEALQAANAKKPNDAVLKFALGRAYSLARRAEDAVRTYREAIALKPPDEKLLLAIYSTLGRTLLQAQLLDDAQAVYAEMESRFPNDPSIREANADLLAGAGRYAEAQARYEVLAGEAGTKKPLYRLRAAEMKLKRGLLDDARADLDGLLDDLAAGDPAGIEARRKLEDSYLAKSDLAGLVAYYEKRLERRPEDFDSVPRLAVALTTAGEADRAIALLEKVIAKAPGKIELRRELAALAVKQKQYAKAMAQFEALDALKKDDLETLRDWGRAKLQDDTLPDAERRKAAAAVWKRLLQTPPDSERTLLAAELFREARMEEEAVSHYRMWIAIAPKEIERHFKLAAYHIESGQADDAKAIWKALADRDTATAEELLAVAEAYLDYQFASDAITLVDRAVKRKPEELAVRLEAAELLARAERPKEALAQLEEAAKRPMPPAKLESIFDFRIRLLKQSNGLGIEAEALAKELAAGRDATGPRWYRLARYREAERNWAAARRALDEALKHESELAAAGQLTATRLALARVAENAGDSSAAIAAYEALLKADGDNARAYQQKLTRLAAQRFDAKLVKQYADRLVAAGLGDFESYRTAADAAKQVADEPLRRSYLEAAVKALPGQAPPLRELAKAWNEELKPDVALDLLWQAFKAGDRPARMLAMKEIAAISSKLNRFEDIGRRLRSLLIGADARLEAQFFEAVALLAVEDLAAARLAFERVLAESPDEPEILKQLSSIAEIENDFTAAIEYERRLERLKAASEERIVTLLIKSGEVSQAMQRWQGRMAGAKPREMLTYADNLIYFCQYELLRPSLQRAVADNPNDWELLYRLAIVQYQLQKPDDAAATFRKLLELNRDDDLISMLADGKLPDDPMIDRLDAPIFSAVRQEVQTLTLSPGQMPVKRWFPYDYGQARLASHYFLYSLAGNRGSEQAKAYQAKRKEACDPAGANRRAWRDRAYLAWALGDDEDLFRASYALMGDGEPWLRRIALLYLKDRLGAALEDPLRARGSPLPAGKVNTEKHLDREELDKLTAAFREAVKQSQEPSLAPALLLLREELLHARREREYEPLWNDWLASLKSPKDFAAAFDLMGQERDVPRALALIARLGQSPDLLASDDFWSRGTLNGFMLLADARALTKDRAGLEKLVEVYLDLHDAARAAARNRPFQPSDVENKRTDLFTLSHDNGAVVYSRRLDMTAPALGNRADDLFFTVFGNVQVGSEAADWPDLLQDAVAARAAKQSGPAKAETLRLLAAVHWWRLPQDRDAALSCLTQAAEADPRNPQCKLDLALVHRLAGRVAEAQAVLESIVDAPPTILRDRDFRLLRLAKAAGDIEAVKKYSGRLLASNLASAELSEMALLLKQAGLPDRAAKVADLARRKAGRSETALLRLLAEAQMIEDADGQVEIAKEIYAQQVNQGTSPRIRAVFGSSIQNADGNAYYAALEVLRDRKRIGEMIAKAEEQCRLMPKSPAASRRLLELYDANGDTAKARAELERLGSLRPKDLELQYFALYVMFNGTEKEACLKRCTMLLKDSPEFYAQYSQQIYGWFSQEKRLLDLAKTLEAAPAKDIGYIPAITLTSSLMQSAVPAERDAGKGCFQRLAKESAGNDVFAMQFVANFALDANLPPELQDITYAALKLSLLPVKPLAAGAEWQGADWLGRTLLIQARKRGQEQQLSEELGTALAKYPQWHGGALLQAILEARAGKIAQARAMLDPLVAMPDTPPEVRGFLANELRSKPGWGLFLRGLLKPAAAKRPDPENNGNNPIDFSVLTAYANLCRDTGAIEEGREAMQAMARWLRARPVQGKQASYYAVYDLQSFGQSLSAYGLHADAALCLARSLDRATNDWRDDAGAYSRWQSCRIEAVKDLTQSFATLAPRGERPLEWGVLLMQGPQGAAQSLTASLVLDLLDAAGPEAVAKINALRSADPAHPDHIVLDALIATRIGEAAAIDRLHGWLTKEAAKHGEPKRLMPVWLAAQEGLRKKVNEPAARATIEAVLKAFDAVDLKLARQFRRMAMLEAAEGPGFDATAESLLAALQSRAPAKGAWPIEDALLSLEAAELAAKRGRGELSRRLAAAALVPGRPRNGGGENPTREESSVEDHLLALLPRWGQSPLPGDFDRLLAIVCPKGRPHEIHSFGNDHNSIPAFEALAEWAIREWRSDDLRRIAGERSGREAILLGLILAQKVGDAVAAENARKKLLKELELSPPGSFFRQARYALAPRLDHAAFGAGNRAAAYALTAAFIERDFESASNDAVELALLCRKAGDDATAEKLLDFLLRPLPRALGTQNINFDRYRIAGVLYFQIGRPEKAWKLMAIWFDLSRVGVPLHTGPEAMAAMLADLPKRSAKDRYALLKPLILPTETQRVRGFELVEPHPTPPPHPAFGTSPPPGLHDLHLHFLQAAAECGKLAEVAADAKSRIVNPEDLATALHAMALILDGKTEEIAAWKARVLKPVDTSVAAWPQSMNWNDQLLPRLVLIRPELRPALSAPVADLLAHRGLQLTPQSTLQFAALASGRSPGPLPPLAHWHSRHDWLPGPGGLYRILHHEDRSPRDHSPSSLTLRHPISGDFEIAFDAGHFAAVEYGGLRIQPPNEGNAMRRYRFAVRNGKQRLYWPSGASAEFAVDPARPWFVLSFSSLQASLMNFTISGNPQRPERIPMISARDPQWNIRYDDEPHNDRFWNVSDGVLESKPLPDEGATLRYPKPLEPGDGIELDFFLEPGKTELQFGFGDVECEFAAKGIELLWNGERRLLPAAVQEALKANAWNNLKLQRDGQALKITVNGKPVLETPLQLTDWEFQLQGPKARALRAKNLAYLPTASKLDLSFDSLTPFTAADREYAAAMLALRDDGDKLRLAAAAPKDDDERYATLRRIVDDAGQRNRRSEIVILADGFWSAAEELAALAAKLKRTQELLPEQNHPKALAWKALLLAHAGDERFKPLVPLLISQFEKSDSDGGLAMLAAQAGLRHPTLAADARKLFVAALPHVNNELAWAAGARLDRDTVPEAPIPEGPWLVHGRKDHWTGFEGGLWNRGNGTAELRPLLPRKFKLAFELHASNHGNWPVIDFGQTAISLVDSQLQISNKAQEILLPESADGRNITFDVKLDAAQWLRVVLERDGSELRITIGDRSRIRLLVPDVEIRGLNWTFTGGGLRNVQLDAEKVPTLDLIAAGELRFPDNSTNQYESNWTIIDRRWLVAGSSQHRVGPNRLLGPGDRLTLQVRVPAEHTGLIVHAGESKTLVAFGNDAKTGEWKTLTIQAGKGEILLRMEGAIPIRLETKQEAQHLLLQPAAKSVGLALRDWIITTK